MNPQRTTLPALALALAVAPPAFAQEGHAHAHAQPEKHALAGTRIIELTVDDAELMHMLLDEGVNPLACRPTRNRCMARHG